MIKNRKDGNIIMKQDKIDELKNKLEQFEKDNINLEAEITENSGVFDEPELSDAEMFRIEKEAEKKAIIDKASESPKDLINLTISSEQQTLVKSDEIVKEKIKKLAGENIETVIGKHKGENLKAKNTNYFLGKENAILSMGEDELSSKDKQITSNWIYNIWWYLFTLTIGLIFIAPLAVIWNKIKAFCYIETITTINNQKTITTKISKFGIFLSILIFLGYLVLLTFSIVGLIKLKAR